MKLSKNKSRWFNQLVKTESPEKVLDEINYIKNSIKLARKYVKGFEASKGWNLRNINRIPLSEINKVKAIRREYIEIENEPHAVIRPKTKEAKQALAAYTGQSPNQKAFAVIKHPSAKVKLQTKKVKGKKSTSVRLERPVKDGVLVEETYLFKDFINQPIYTYEQAEQALEHMLPFLPDGHYVFVSRKHGNIVNHATKNKLLEFFANTFYTYKDVEPSGKDSRGIFQDLVGVRLTGFRQNDADREYRERTSRRSIMARNRAALRARERRKISERVRRRYK